MQMLREVLIGAAAVFSSYAAYADSAANDVAVVANAVYAYVASVVHMFCCCSC